MTDIRLSKLQAEAVYHLDGPLVVVAGPGSGKTRVLTERVRYLLSDVSGHFHVLALTFTNKAANEMSERLDDTPASKDRAFIGTIHGFCLDMLSERGKPLGLTAAPQIFEQASDRRQILLEAVTQDPLLREELESSHNRKARINTWIQEISRIKAHPMSYSAHSDDLTERLYDAYNAALRAAGGYDFDDLLLLAYQLLTEFPKIAAFYRRLYRFICIDEAQDLNEAQYAVLVALCGSDFNNVMMVGDPKQSIYGFNTSSPRYMERFTEEFGAKRIELTENFRSSRAVVSVAQKLQPTYMIQEQLPIEGEVDVYIAGSQEEEARNVADKISSLLEDGHADVEGNLTAERIAVLGRTRYALLFVEEELTERGISFFTRLTTSHEFQSQVMNEFFLALRIVANPYDALHLKQLLREWNLPDAAAQPQKSSEVLHEQLVSSTEGAVENRPAAILRAWSAISNAESRLRLGGAISVLREYADSLSDEEKVPIYEDTEVLRVQWDNYLRSVSNSGVNIGSFMSAMALGTTQQANQDGVALLTVHSSKGMEFDAVFCVGMAEGVFPDYRAINSPNALAEEQRNAFVAATRSKRLLYFSYSTRRVMPWGDTWIQKPSRFLVTADLV